MLSKGIKGEIVGIELTGDAFLMVHAYRNGSKVRVVNFDRKQSLADSVDAALDVPYHLSTIFGDRKLRRLRIHCTIPCKHMCIRVVTVPVMPYQELYQAIRSKIHKYISVDIDQVHYNFSVLGESEERGVKKLDVVFAAIEKRVYDKFMNKFDAKGVRPQIVIPSCFAAWDVVRASEASKDIASLMLIDISGNNTELTVCSENQFVFTRNISIGSNDFLEILKEHADLLTHDPEKVKSLWLGSQEFSSGALKIDSALKGAGERLQSEAEMLRREMELTSNHYYQISHGGKIDKCIVFGQGVRIVGLIDFLRKKVEIPVEEFRLSDSFVSPKGREAELKENASEYAIAFGAIVCNLDVLNLSLSLTPQTKWKILPLQLPSMNKVRFAIIPFFAIPLIIIFCLLKGGTLYFNYQIKSFKNQQLVLQERTRKLSQVKKQMDIFAKKKDVYRELLKKYPNYSGFIIEICKAIPNETIVVDELNISNSELSDRASGQLTTSGVTFVIRGRVLAKQSHSGQATAFVLALEKSGVFKNISVTIDEPKKTAQGVSKGSQEADDLEESYFTISGTIVAVG